MEPLKQARHAVPPAAAALAWAGAIVMAASDRAGLDADDRLTLALAIVASVWVIVDVYYRRLTRDRQQAHAGHDVGVLAEGVAAYMRQDGGGGDGQRAPGTRTDA
jgi:hypothetical protein